MPQWAVRADGTPVDPDLLVLDLDPGPPATVVECSRVALLLRERLAADGLVGYPKTSGSKGMQVYVPLEPTPAERTSGYAKTLAEDLERAEPTLVVSRMAKELRGGKVFVDWSQNNGAKTTVAPYSLARAGAADGVHAADVGRGRVLPRRRRTWSSPPTTCSTGSRRTATSSRSWTRSSPRHFRDGGCSELKGVQRSGLRVAPQGDGDGLGLTVPHVGEPAPACPGRSSGCSR